MPNIQKFITATSIIKWFRQNALLFFSAFLLVFIPLFPKIPFFSPIEKYIVRVRIEDFLVFGVFLFWLKQLFTQKIKVKHITSGLIITYAIVGLLSVISALWVIKTVPLTPDHVLKTLLHYLRYLEYFLLFFITYSSINKPEDINLLLNAILVAIFAVSIYGIGQKYFYWPVYSTMNREFSKGVRLYLTEHARVQSTFAGHYDLAAYLVITLPLVLALAYQAHSKKKKLLLFGLHFLGVWLLIMSAARASFVGYALATVIVVLLFGLKQKTLGQKLSWICSRFVSLWMMVIIILASFGSDIYDRFLQVMESYPQLYQPYSQVETKTVTISHSIGNMLHLPQLFSWNKPPQNSLSTTEVAVLVASDTRPTTKRPKDVYTDIPDKVIIATTSASGQVSQITVEKPRTWSPNAFKYGLSMAIRLDTLWPRAIQGFLREPLFGSGYATLNKTSFTDFTIADSTDNNFLRTLGETGCLGFLSFYGVIFSSLFVAVKGLKKSSPLLQALSIGYIAGTLGLLFNAFYIDVFAASKVAFTFWAVTGLLTGYYEVNK